MVKILNKNFGVYDPHEVVLSFFEPNEAPLVSHNNLREFKFNSSIFLFALFIIKSAFTNYLPHFLDILIVAVGSFIVVNLLLGAVIRLHKSARKRGIIGIAETMSLLMLIIMFIGLF